MATWGTDRAVRRQGDNLAGSVRGGMDVETGASVYELARFEMNVMN